jgi:hypothetical protein
LDPRKGVKVIALIVILRYRIVVHLIRHEFTLLDPQECMAKPRAWTVFYSTLSMVIVQPNYRQRKA